MCFLCCSLSLHQYFIKTYLFLVLCPAFVLMSLYFPAYTPACSLPVSLFLSPSLVFTLSCSAPCPACLTCLRLSHAPALLFLYPSPALLPSCSPTPLLNLPAQPLPVFGPHPAFSSMLMLLTLCLDLTTLLFSCIALFAVYFLYLD